MELSGVDGPMIGRHRLGSELRRLRVDRGLRLDDAAARLDVAASTLSRIETGKSPTRTSYLHALLDLYGVDDADRRRMLAEMARTGQRRGWWADYADVLPAGERTYVGLEDAASRARSFTDEVIPGLLQTPEYAAAAHRAMRPGLSPGQVNRLVNVTMRRQELIAAGRLRLYQVVDESVLLRMIGSEQVMAGQLERLLSVAAGSLVTLQVIPFSRPRSPLCRPFTVLQFADRECSSVAVSGGTGSRAGLVHREAVVTTMESTFAVLAGTAMSPEATISLLERLAQRPEGTWRDLVPAVLAG